MIRTMQNNKIFRSVVIFNTIQMMNMMIRRNQFSILLFGHQNVFQNIFPVVTRMIGSIGKDVALNQFYSAPAPFRIVLAALVFRFPLSMAFSVTKETFMSSKAAGRTI